MPKLAEIKKLRPEDRLKKLKELEEQRKKEIEEAKEMVKQSHEEIAEEDLIKKMNPPEAEEIQVEKLFRPRKEEVTEPAVEPLTPEEPGEVVLEDALSDAPSIPPEQEIAQSSLYQVNQLEQDLRGKSTDSIYKSMSSMMEQPRENMNQYQKNKIEAAYNIMKEREDLYGDATSQKIGGSVSKILSLHDRIQDDYRN
jgi:hypothetical protein|tara:strand:+ start:156 stop:746 length:591 start_codon:yes stop_codon:yes gene_type:complete